MRPFPRDKRSPRGWTLIELMMVVAVLGLILPVTIRLFTKVSQGMAADEMHNILKKLNEETLLRLDIRVKSNKHMFRNDTSGVTFLGCILNGTPAPPALATGMTSVLPDTQPDTAVSGSVTLPTFSTAKGAVGADFGNTLFFAAYDSPATLLGNTGPQTYTAPLTVMTKAGGTVVNYGAANGGGPATVILDVYRFYYYYLTNSVKPLRGVPSYALVEWRSVQFVDFNELSSIGDTTLRQSTVKWLAKSSSPINFPGGPVTLAYNPSQTDPTLAFYTLNAITGTYTQMNPPRIPQGGWTILTRASTGVLSSGFRYGVSPNTAGWVDAPPAGSAAPLYAAASGNFPGGFEVGLIGTGAGVQVLTRCLLVARGAVKQTIYNDSTVVHNARDSW